MLLKCSVNCVKLGLFSSFCSFAQSRTSGICQRRRGEGKYHTLKWDFYPKIPSCSLCSQPLAGTRPAVPYNLGELAGNIRHCRRSKPSHCPQPILISVPRFYRRVQHPAGSAAQLFHGCGNHAASLACGKQPASTKAQQT